jgi:hypothetical protein
LIHNNSIPTFLCIWLNRPVQPFQESQ